MNDTEERRLRDLSMSRAGESMKSRTGFTVEETLQKGTEVD